MADPAYVTNGYNFSFHLGQEIAQIQADTLAHAQALGQTLANAFGRSVKMNSCGTGTSFVYTPAAQAGPGPAWAANTAYTTASYVTNASGYYFRCTGAGTSHPTTEPTWPTTIGSTVVDSGATWTCWGRVITGVSY